MTATVSGGRLTIRNGGRDTLSHVFAVDVRREWGVDWHLWERVGPGETREFEFRGRKERNVGRFIAAALVKSGLYEREAQAMVKTWESSWFGEDGVRVFYLLPPSMTDELLPLQITPKPAELVRVIVGRTELLTPEREAEVAAIVAELGSDSAEDRDAASKKLARHGRFAEPLLKRAMRQSADAEVRARCEELLKRIRRVE